MGPVGTANDHEVELLRATTFTAVQTPYMLQQVSSGERLRACLNQLSLTASNNFTADLQLQLRDEISL